MPIEGNTGANHRQFKIIIINDDRDSDFADKLVKDLQAQGFPVLHKRDPRFTAVIPGSMIGLTTVGMLGWAMPWLTRLRSIMITNIIVFILSKESCNGEYIRNISYELIAINSNYLGPRFHLIPIVLDDKAAKNMPSQLRNIKFADFRGNYEEALNQFSTSIINLQ